MHASQIQTEPQSINAQDHRADAESNHKPTFTLQELGHVVHRLRWRTAEDSNSVPPSPVGCPTSRECERCL